MRHFTLLGILFLSPFNLLASMLCEEPPTESVSPILEKAAASYDQKVFDQNYKYVGDQIARLEADVEMLDDEFQLRSAEISTPPTPGSLYEGMESVPKWWPNTLQLTLQEKQKALENWKELKRKVDSGEIKPEDFAKTENRNTIQFYKAHAKDMPHPEVLTQAGVTDAEAMESTPIPEEQIKNNQSAAQIAVQTKTETFPVLPSIEYEYFSKRATQENIARIVTAKEKEFRNWQHMTKILKMEDLFKFEIEPQGSQMRRMIRIDLQDPRRKNDLQLNEDDTRTASLLLSFLPTETQAKIGYSTNGNKSLNSSNNGIAAASLNNRKAAASLINALSKIILTEEDYRNILIAANKVRDAKNLPERDVEQILSSLPQLKGANLSEPTEIASKQNENSTSPATPELLSTEKEAQEEPPQLQIFPASPIFQETKVEFASVDEALEKGYFDPSETSARPQLSQASFSESQFLQAVKNARAQSKWKPKPHHLIDMPQPVCQGQSAICEFLSLLGNAELNSGNLDFDKEAAYAFALAHTYLGEVPENIDQSLRAYFENKLGPLTDEEWATLLKAGVGADEGLGVFGSGSPYKLVNSLGKTSGRLQTWNPPASTAEYLRANEWRSQYQISGYQSFRSGSVSASLIREMVDMAEYPIIHITSDSRFLTEDWFVPVPVSPIGHALQVVGYNRGIDPFDMQEKDYFIVIDTFTANPMPYKVAVNKIQPMIRGVARVTDIIDRR